MSKIDISFLWVYILVVLGGGRFSYKDKVVDWGCEIVVINFVWYFCCTNIRICFFGGFGELVCGEFVVWF